MIMYTAKAAALFLSEADVHLLQAAKLDTCPDREKHVIILMDEMHLREDLVYDRHSGLCVAAGVTTICSSSLPTLVVSERLKRVLQ